MKHTKKIVLAALTIPVLWLSGGFVAQRFEMQSAPN